MDVFTPPHVAPTHVRKRRRYLLGCVIFVVVGCILKQVIGCAIQSSYRGIWGLTPTPNGKTIYFIAGAGHGCALRALDLTSGRTSVIYDFGKYAGDPVCSPDGKWLLLTGGPDDSRGQINRFDLATRILAPFVVSSVSDGAPIINRDGSTVAFARYARSYTNGFGGLGWTDADVWVGSTNSTTYRQVTHMKAKWFSPGMFLPDNRHLIVSCTTRSNMEQVDLYLLDLSDGSMKRLTNAGTDNRDPALSPDGKTVVFMSDRSKDGAELWRMRPDGSDVQQITHIHNCRCTTPNFLPNGHSIVFTFNSQEIRRVDLDGTNLQKLFSLESK